MSDCSSFDVWTCIIFLSRNSSLSIRLRYCWNVRRWIARTCPPITIIGTPIVAALYLPSEKRFHQGLTLYSASSAGLSDAIAFLSIVQISSCANHPLPRIRSGRYKIRCQIKQFQRLRTESTMLSPELLKEQLPVSQVWSREVTISEPNDTDGAICEIDTLGKRKPFYKMEDCRATDIRSKTESDIHS